MRVMRRKKQCVFLALDVWDGGRFRDWVKNNFRRPTLHIQDNKVLKFHVGKLNLCLCSFENWLNPSSVEYVCFTYSAVSLNKSFCSTLSTCPPESSRRYYAGPWLCPVPISSLLWSPCHTIGVIWRARTQSQDDGMYVHFTKIVWRPNEVFKERI